MSTCSTGTVKSFSARKIRTRRGFGAVFTSYSFMDPPRRRCASVRRKPEHRDRSSAGADPPSVAALGAIPIRGGPTMAGAMHTESVTYRADTTLRGFLATDTMRTRRRPGVLVVHEWWG